MKRNRLFLIAVAAAMPLLVLSAPRARAATTPNLLPTPKAINVEDGRMPITAESRVVAADAKLKPLAEILSQEILVLTKLRLVPAEGPSTGSAPGAPKAGDIVQGTVHPDQHVEEQRLPGRASGGRAGL